MAASDLSVALKITGDAQSAVAALEETRRAQLNAFRAGREEADKAAAKWKVAEGEVKKLASAARESGGGHAQHAGALAAAAQQAGKSKAAWVESTQALHQQRAALQQNAQALAAMRASEAQAAAEAARRRQAARLDSARETLDIRPFRDIAREIALGEAAYKRLAASGKLSTAELAQAKMKLIERTQALRAQTNGWAEALGKVRGSAMALAGTGASIGAAVAQAARFELAMAQARKYIDFPDENGFARLRAELLAMTRELPLTAVELSKIAAAGGQAGVAADEIGDYVRIVAKIAEAFDMLPEEAGAAFGKLRTVFRLSIAQTKDLGDTINWVGDKMANVAERDLVNVAVRAGGMARQLGLSAKQTVALGAAFLTLGTPPEIAANAINALLLKLSTLNGAEDKVQEAFSSYIGSIEEFTAAMLADPAKAIDAFLEKVNALPESVRPIALSHILGLEYADDIAKLASGIDDYRRALELAADAAAQGGVDAQFAELMRTASKQFELLKNAAEETAIVFGNQLLPGLVEVTKAIRDVVVNVGKLIDAVPGSAAALSVLVSSLAGIGLARVSMAAIGVVVGKLTGGLTLAAAGAAGLARGLLFVAARFAPWAIGIQAVLWGLDKLFGPDREAEQAEQAKKTQANADAFGKLAEAVRKAGGNYQVIEAAARQAATADEATQQQLLANAQNYTDTVLKKAQQLAGEKMRLADLVAQRQAVASGQETRSEAQSVADRIAEVKKLSDVKKREMDKAISDMNRYRDAAIAAYERAAGIATSTSDKIRELRRRDMTEAQRERDVALQATEKLAAAERTLAEARRMAAAGNVSGAEKAAAAAEKLAQEAESLGTNLKNTGQAIDIVGKAGAIAEAAARAAGDANQKAAEGMRQRAADLQREIDGLTKKLDDLARQERIIKIDADIAAAQANIRAIQSALDNLRDKTITITTVHRSVEQHAIGGLVGMSRMAAGVRYLATGGHLPGYGGGDRIRAMLEAGEFVVRKEAVRHYGLAALQAINAMRVPLPVRAAGEARLPGFSTGGPVGRVAAGRAGDVVDIRVQFGPRRIELQGARDQAMALAGALRELSRGA